MTKEEIAIKLNISVKTLKEYLKIIETKKHIMQNKQKELEKELEEKFGIKIKHKKDSIYRK